MNVTLDAVKPTSMQILSLWKMLQERTPQQAISHRQMPTWEQHCQFVDTWHERYIAWYMIGNERVYVGNTYLTKQREVGIHIFQEHRGLGYGHAALDRILHLHGRPLLANINPQNSESIEFFTRQGFKPLQHTYQLT